MQLVRHGELGRELPGLRLEDGSIIDVSAAFGDYNESFFALNCLSTLREWLKRHRELAPVVSPQTRIAAPVARPSKIVCIGKNYLDHALEFGEGVPTEPVLFMKASSAWSGPFDDVQRPPGAEKLDYEVELAVVIAQPMRHVAQADVLHHIAGYTVLCDYSERAFQKDHGGQWTKGKSADTFAPCGPFLLTTDEVPDPQNLRLWTTVNGELRQNGYTGDMIFSVAHCLSYISRFMTLLPGDVVATGTPSGVAMGMNPPKYLQPGDLVEVGIEGIGHMSHRIVAG